MKPEDVFQENIQGAGLARTAEVHRARDSKVEGVEDVADRGAKMLDEYARSLVLRARETGRGELALKIAEVKKYFLSAENSKETSPLSRMAKLYDYLERPLESDNRLEYESAIDGHFKILIERAFDQHLENPEQYVSHGFDHSLNVADYAKSVVEKFPEIVSNITSTYGISEGHAKFVIENAALFHDCGYCSLAEGATKTVHSLASVGILMDSAYRDNMRTLVQTSTSEKKDLLLYDLEGAVLFHNADKVDRTFSSKVINTRGEYIGLADEESILKVVTRYSKDGDKGSLGDIVVEVKNATVAENIKGLLEEAFIARGLDIDFENMPQIRLSSAEGEDKYFGRSIDLEPGDKAIGLEYKPADTLDYSLLSVLRVADNMDMLPERFSEVQKLPAFQEICKVLGDQVGAESRCLKILEKAVNGESISTAIVEFLQNAGSEDGLTDEDLAGIQKITERARNLNTEGEFKKDAKELASLLKDFVIHRVFKKYDPSSEESENLLRIGKLQNSESFRHFGGCEGILSIGIDSDKSSGEAVLNVIVKKETFNDLQQYSVQEKTRDKHGNLIPVTVPIGEYQLWRLSEALQVNKHGERPIKLKVFDDEGKELTDLFSLQEKI